MVHLTADYNCLHPPLFCSLYVCSNVTVACFLTLLLQVDTVICAKLPPTAADTDIREEKEQRKKL